MDPLDLAGERAPCGVDGLHPLAFERHASVAAADEHRSDEQAHLVDLPGVEERAARCGPPSSRSDWMPRAPSSDSAERTRAPSFSPGATITSTPAASRASVEAREAPREL